MSENIITNDYIEAFGAIESDPDIRDYRIDGTTIEETKPTFPNEFELDMPAVKNQMNVGSCVAHSLSTVIEYYNQKQHNEDIEMSVGYIYGNRGILDHQGSGMVTRVAIANTCAEGDVPNTLFPFNEEVPGIIEKVRAEKNNLEQSALPFKFTSYFKVKTADEIKTALMKGCPVVFAIDWYKGMKVKDGILTSDFKEKSGGHCMVIYGWDERGWKFQNSWGCYDTLTEVLTDSGFKKFSECTNDDLFATLNEDGELEYQKSDHYFEYDYNGDMFNYENSKINLCVTPNHNIYYRTKHKPFMLQQAQTIVNKHLIFKRTAHWKGKEEPYFSLPSVEQKINQHRTDVLPELKIPMEDFLTFMGYYISEGCCCTRDMPKDKGGKEYSILICQTKERAKNIMRDNLNKLPFSIIENKKGFVINNQQLWNYVKDLGYAHNKHIPKELLELSPYYLRFLFEALMLGDGSSVCGTNGAYKNMYYTSSPFLRDQFQELCLKLGYASNVYEDNRIGRVNSRGIQRYVNYHIKIQKYKTIWDKDTRYDKTPTITEYSDKVYCVEVPNHTLFVRRGGKTCWCGNSLWGNGGRAILPYDFEIREAYCVVDEYVGDINIKKPFKAKTAFGKWLVRCLNKIYCFFYRIWYNAKH